MKSLIFALLELLATVMMGLGFTPWAYGQCEPLVFVGSFGSCEKHNTASCSFTSTGPAEAQGFIVPFDHSPPGAYTITPSMEFYKTDDDLGQPAGGYCIPTTDSQFVGKIYGEAGHYRQTGNGSQGITFNVPAYPATEETIRCGATYGVDARSGLDVGSPNVYCLKAQLKDYTAGVPPSAATLKSTIPAGQACTTVHMGDYGEINIPMQTVGQIHFGDPFFYEVYTLATAPSGAQYRVMHKECDVHPHQ